MTFRAGVMDGYYVIKLLVFDRWYIFAPNRRSPLLHPQDSRRLSFAGVFISKW